MATPHLFDVQIYYEDTDFSGVVYHANYLRFFERAREHVLGAGELVRMWRDEQKGFVVYKATQQFKEGAVFGDIVEIRSVARIKNEYRVIFDQKTIRKSNNHLLIDTNIKMIFIDTNHNPIPIPLNKKLHTLFT